MKELRYILTVLFSSLIIISGVGISVVQYCCAVCETTQSCCTSGCSKCHHTHRASRQTCKDTGCTAVYYKVDFVKHAHESVSLYSSGLMPMCLLKYFPKKEALGKFRE